MLTKTTYEHILIDDHGIPQIAGANTKVVELVLDNLAYGWSPEELAFQHSHLTLGQIHSALAYYWDHRDEIDQDIERRLQRCGDHAAFGRGDPVHETTAALRI